MPNLATVLKLEIARVARKELRAEVESLRKASSHYRSEIAGLKRRLATLEKQSKWLRRSAAPTGGAAEDEGGSQLRFRVEGFAALRRKLGISAELMGKLLGVSGQSVYKWESGKAAPRKSHLPAIAEVRKLGKRGAAARLASLAIEKR